MPSRTARTLLKRLRTSKYLHWGSWCLTSSPPSSCASPSEMPYKWSRASWRKTRSSSRSVNSPSTRWSLCLSSAWIHLLHLWRGWEGTGISKEPWWAHQFHQALPIPKWKTSRDSVVSLCVWHIHYAPHELDWGIYQPHQLLTTQHQVNNRRRAGWLTTLSGHLRHNQWRWHPQNNNLP